MARRQQPGPTDSSGNSLIPSGFANSYEIAFANLVGTVPSLTNSYNYHVDSSSSGTLLADGAYLQRHFSANEFEWYVQDAWHATPNLILTFGLRHTILQTPWETKGQQVAPTIDTDAWYKERESQAQQGQIYDARPSIFACGPLLQRAGILAKVQRQLRSSLRRRLFS